MSGKNILIVEDEKPIREMVGFSLGRAGFSVTEAGDISEAFECLAHQLPDLILLDWMLPGASGLELARRLKRDELTRDVPIIMLTARGEEEDKVTGLEAGADDYITKPFSPRELQARIRAVLRRSSNEDESGVVRIEGLELDTESHRVSANQVPVDMGPTEFRLLEFFMTHPERVYSREQLLDRVWGRNSFVEERTVDVHILRLRKALAPSGYEAMIQTLLGAGYLLSSRFGLVTRSLGGALIDSCANPWRGWRGFALGASLDWAKPWAHLGGGAPVLGCDAPGSLAGSSAQSHRRTLRGWMAWGSWAAPAPGSSCTASARSTLAAADSGVSSGSGCLARCHRRLGSAPPHPGI